MSNVTSDNGATLAGYTEQYIIEFAGCNLHVSVKPDTDFDDMFQCFCHDEQECVLVNGWTIEHMERI